jgi:hypothetical protein
MATELVCPGREHHGWLSQFVYESVGVGSNLNNCLCTRGDYVLWGLGFVGMRR